MPETRRPPAAAERARCDMPPQMLALLLVGSLTVLGGSAVSPALPGLHAHFADQPHAGLLTRFVITAPALAIPFVAPLAGILMDRHGRRRLLLAALVLYALAGVSGLVLEGLTSLLLGRVALGVAIAGIMTGVSALGGDYFAAADRERFMGLQSAFVGLCGLIFFTSAGWLAGYSWRAPFAVYGVALLLLPLAWRQLHDVSRAARTEAGDSGETWGRSRLVVLTAMFAIAMSGNVIFTMLPTQLPFLLRESGIDAPSRAGIALGLAPLFVALTSFQFPRLRARLSPSAIFALGYGLFALGFAGLWLAGHYALLLGAVALCGIGMGALQPNLMVVTLMAAPPATRARTMGALTATLFVGQFLSPLVSQPLIERIGLPQAFGVAGGVCALVSGAIAVGLLRR